MTPLVSVVMSVYNGERFLREAIDSILSQTFTDFEFIIVNDGSTDRTREILESYGDDRIILVHQENTGLTCALNKGIGLARGKYIARQDADDISRPERLELQVAFMEDHPTVGLLGTRFEFIDESGKVIRASHLPLENNVLQERLIEINQFCHGSALIRKEALDKVGLYREFFRHAQDYDLWLLISEQFEVANLPDLLCLYRELTTAISSDKILLQSRYAGAAVEMARQRRETGTDEIAQGKKPTLPPADRFSKSLQKKLSTFYSQNPKKMLASLNIQSKDSDLYFLFELICSERLLYEEEVRQKNQQLRQAGERINSKDAQIRAMYPELEQIKLQLESTNAEQLKTLEESMDRILSKTHQNQEMLARVCTQVEKELLQKNEELAEGKGRYLDKCHEVRLKDQEIIRLEEDGLKRHEMSGTLSELELKLNEKRHKLLAKEEIILEKDRELVLLAEELCREKQRLEEEISRRDGRLAEKKGLLRQKSDELFGKENELEAKSREVADREQGIRLLNEKAAAEKLRIDEELAQKSKLLGEKVDLLGQMHEDMQAKDKLLTVKDQEIRLLNERAAAVKLRSDEELAQKDTLLGEKLDLLKKMYEDLQEKERLLVARDKELKRLGEKAAAEKLTLETELAQRDRLVGEKAELISQRDGQLKEKVAEMTGRDERIQQLEAAVTKADQKLEEHRRLTDEQLAHLNDKRETLEQQLLQKDRSLRELEAELQTKSDGLRELEEDLARFKEERVAEQQDNEQRISEKEQYIETLLNSRSWKVTAPFRTVGAMLQRK